MRFHRFNNRAKGYYDILWFKHTNLEGKGEQGKAERHEKSDNVLVLTLLLQQGCGCAHF